MSTRGTPRLGRQLPTTQGVKPTMGVFEVIVVMVVKDEILPGCPDENRPDQKYMAHKAHIVHHSPYFARNLSNVETKEHRLVIKNVDIVAFGHFVHWIYYQNVDPFKEVGNFFLGVKLWLLGQRFEVPGLQNCIMTWLREMARQDMEFGLADWQWKNVFEIAGRPAGIVLKNLLQDILVMTKISSNYTEMLNHASADSLREVALRMKQREADATLFDFGPASDYHVTITPTDT